MYGWFSLSYAKIHGAEYKMLADETNEAIVTHVTRSKLRKNPCSDAWFVGEIWLKRELIPKGITSDYFCDSTNITRVVAALLPLHIACVVTDFLDDVDVISGGAAGRQDHLHIIHVSVTRRFVTNSFEKLPEVRRISGFCDLNWYPSWIDWAFDWQEYDNSVRAWRKQHGTDCKPKYYQPVIGFGIGSLLAVCAVKCLQK